MKGIYIWYDPKAVSFERPNFCEDFNSCQEFTGLLWDYMQYVE